MKKIITFLLLSVVFGCGCHCDRVVPKQLTVNYFKTQQLIRQDIVAETSPVAFSLLLTDSTTYRRLNSGVVAASFLNFRMSACECWDQAYIANPITELQIREVRDGKVSEENKINNFVGRLSTDDRVYLFRDFKAVSVLLDELKAFNVSQQSAAFLQLYDTTGIQTPNVSFLVKFTLADGKKVERITPQFFTK